MLGHPTDASDERAAAFTAALAEGASVGSERPGGLVGLEQEFSLMVDGRPVDFRDRIHDLPVDGRRLDPGDSYAYRCRSGMVVTCDGAEPEVVLPPLPVVGSAFQDLEAASQAATTSLRALVGPTAHLAGISTHLSVSVPEPLTRAVAMRFCRSFAVPALLLSAGSDGAGVMVRHRWGRVELGTHALQGPRLATVATLMVGGIRACASVAADGAGGHGSPPLPPALDLRLIHTIERSGWFVSRTAGGPDLLAVGRRARLHDVGGEVVTAQSLLERAWATAAAALPEAGLLDGLAGEAMVAGSAPLPIEGPLAHVPRAPRLEPNVHGRLVDGWDRPGWHVEAVVARWEFAVFRVTGTGRTIFAGVPRAVLERFEAMFCAGQLDEVLEAYAAQPTRGRTLSTWTQTSVPSLYDDLAPNALQGGTGLVPEEPPWFPVFVARGASERRVTERSAERAVERRADHEDDDADPAARSAPAGSATIERPGAASCSPTAGPAASPPPEAIASAPDQVAIGSQAGEAAPERAPDVAGPDRPLHAGRTGKAPFVPEDPWTPIGPRIGTLIWIVLVLIGLITGWVVGNRTDGSSTPAPPPVVATSTTVHATTSTSTVATTTPSVATTTSAPPTTTRPPTTTAVPARVTRVAGGWDHPPFARTYADARTGAPVVGASVILACVDAVGVPAGSVVVVRWQGPTGIIEATGRVDAAGRAQAAGGINQVGTYTLGSVAVLAGSGPERAVAAPPTSTTVTLPADSICTP